MLTSVGTALPLALGKMSSNPDAPAKLPPLDSIKGVLFDIDGTLTDSDPLHYLA